MGKVCGKCGVEKPLTGYFGDGTDEFHGDRFDKQIALDAAPEPWSLPWTRSWRFGLIRRVSRMAGRRSSPALRRSRRLVWTSPNRQGRSMPSAVRRRRLHPSRHKRHWLPPRYAPARRRDRVRHRKTAESGQDGADLWPHCEDRPRQPVGDLSQPSAGHPWPGAGFHPHVVARGALGTEPGRNPDLQGASPHDHLWVLGTDQRDAGSVSVRSLSEPPTAM